MNNAYQKDVTGQTAVRTAITAAQAGNNPLARFNLENAVKSEHDNPDYWLWLAWTADSPASSISALEEALRLSPNHRLAQQGLTWALGMLGFAADKYHSEDSQPASFDDEVLEPTGLESARLLNAPVVDVAEEVTPDCQFEVYDDGDYDDGEQLVDDPAPDYDEVQCDDNQPVPFPPSVSDDLEIEDFDDQELGDEIPSGSIIDFEDELPASPVQEQDDLGVEPCSLPDLHVQFDESDESSTDVECQDSELAGDVLDEIEASIEQELNRTDAPAPVEEPPCDPVSDHEPVATDSDDEHATDTESTDERVTILAVDDSPTIRKIVSMGLESAGYKVITAADGMEAIKRITVANPSLVLTDINMPTVDGYQLCKLIKSHEKTRSIPVIMLSGKDGMFDKMKGKFVGCNDYITKPFQSAELLEKVSSYVPLPVSDA